MESLIPKFNLEKNVINPHIIFPNGDNPLKVYYEETDSKNYTSIHVPLKRHHRQELISAVRNQLLYFDKIRFLIDKEDGTREEQSFQAKIQYNSENLIVSDTNRYGQPHIVIVKDKASPIGVCYGNVDFDQLEMEKLYGPIGFKCPIRSVYKDDDGNEIEKNKGVSVTPSRETVIWDEHTKAYVSGVIEAASEEATKLIETELVEDDFILWLKKCKDVISRSSGSNNALAKISKMVDTSKIRPKYKGVVKFGSSVQMFGNTFKISQVSASRKGNSKEISIKVDPKSKEINFSDFYYSEGSILKKRNKYIASTKLTGTSSYYGDSYAFYVITPLTDEELKAKALGIVDAQGDVLSRLKKERDFIKSKIKESSAYRNYEEVIIPDDWVEPKDEDSSGVDTSAPKDENEKSTEQIRKELGKTLVSKVYYKGGYQEKFGFSRKEIDVIDIQQWNTDVFYADSSNDSDLIRAAVIASGDYQSIREGDDIKRMFNPEEDTLFFKCAKNRLPLLKRSVKRGINKVDDFFFKKELKDNEKASITMHSAFRKWYTARRIGKQLADLEFLKNYKIFNKEASELYANLRSYVDKYHIDIESYGMQFDNAFKKDIVEEMIGKCDNLANFQLFIRDNDDENDISRKSVELFGNDGYDEGYALDLEIWDNFVKLQEHFIAVQPLFSQILCLIDTSENISQSVEGAIRDYIEFKNLEYFKLDNNNDNN